MSCIYYCFFLLLKGSDYAHGQYRSFKRSEIRAVDGSESVGSVLKPNCLCPLLHITYLSFQQIYTYQVPPPTHTPHITATFNNLQADGSKETKEQEMNSNRVKFFSKIKWMDEFKMSTPFWIFVAARSA